MSGGSFNYLYQKDISELTQYIREIAEMRDFLEDNGCKQSAKATKTLLKKLKAIIELENGKLRKVWHAAEWYRSGDWGKDDLIKANKAFAKEENK